MNIQPFTINLSQDILDDLKFRLTASRIPDEIENSDWEYGASLSFMKEINKYWRLKFNWREQEEFLNSFHHFKADIDGESIHFIHEPGKGKNSRPLIITHGWPGSFLEMIKIIPMLTDPVNFGGNENESFDVIVPSLPGYGFSGHPKAKGMNAFKIAKLWQKLMKGLGYENFGAQGGDWGASVSTCLGFLYPQNVTGVHLNYIPGSYMPYLGPESSPLSETEQQWLKDLDSWYDLEGGYAHQQRTKPLTLAYGLNDSPLGLAAWIIDKFRDWSDCNGDVENSFSKNWLLSNVTLYWATETIRSSMQLYAEGKLRPLAFKQGERMQVPCGIIHLAKEAPFPPREWIDRFYNIQQWTEVNSGGHFAAMEEPQALVRDIRKFFEAI